MTRSSPPTTPFILDAFDRDLWCPVAQTLFHVTDATRLRAILGLDADEDPNFDREYGLDDGELALLVTRLGVAFDRSQFESSDLEFRLRQCVARDRAPYLIHTGYELPLLLDGGKKLAHFSDSYPPMTFHGEDRFDHWVATGHLHKEELIEPFDAPIKRWRGIRRVYYAPKGEEWRIPAHKLIREAASQAGDWNESIERLEGMLFGYEKWQNDWWIDIGVGGGGYGGTAFFCPVTEAGMTWIEAARFCALPPVEGSSLEVAGYDADAEALQALMFGKPDYVAVARFNVRNRHIRDFFESGQDGSWHVPAQRIGELNRHLRGSVAIVARRDGGISSDRA